ncbi:unnamed protein product [Euphydryas editha]|uniref:Uncharacterized protein n=1 Tax=Euphydryas editha TaxID=104508 RepID=A0AAU9UQ22_EUPED|nr:unnamed protein product [Euphydryas editha]
MSLKRKRSFRTKTEFESVPYRVKCTGACKQNKEVDVVHSSTTLQNLTMVSDCDEIVSNRQTDSERMSQDVENIDELQKDPTAGNTDVMITSESNHDHEPLVRSERVE